MSRLRQLIGEVHRRSLWQVLAIYGASGWVVYEIVEALTSGLGLPDWVPPLAIVLLLIGLPICLATAFVQEGGPSLSPGDPTLLPGGGSATAETSAPTVTRRLFTWRNAILGGALAFALLGIGTAGYMAMRVTGIGPVGSLVAKGVLDERDRILLADFENRTSDSTLALVVTEALRVDLAESPIVTLADPAVLGRALERMEREADAALELPLARELATRLGLKAVIGGEIGSAGTGFVLSARLMSAENGEVLAAVRETAGDSAEIIKAIDELSEGLRERIGESLRTIRSNDPLPEVTTGSLQALRKYAQARRLDRSGEHERTVALLEEAIGLDTTFAAAYTALGAELHDAGQERARWVRAFTKAYELRDRLTELERSLAIGRFHYYVTRDFDRAATAFRNLRDIYPDRATNILANTYWWLEEYELAEPLYEEVVAQDSLWATGYGNLLFAQVPQGKFEEAQAILDLMAQRLPDHPSYRVAGYRLATAMGDYETAEAHARGLAEAEGASLFWRAQAARGLAITARIRGQLATHDRHRRDALATNERRELPAEYLEDAIEVGLTDAAFRNAGDRTLRVVEEALDRYPLQTLEPLDRPYLNLATLYAAAGMTDRARDLIAEFEAEIDPELRREAEPWRRLNLGYIALQEERPPDAIREARSALEAACPNCELHALALIGRAHDIAAEGDSAIAYYERYAETPSYVRSPADSYWLARVYERLGDLYEQRPDTAKAIYYYGKFVDLWKEADPELQPRVEAARRAIAALSPDR